jgi:hypothetical protein
MQSNLAITAWRMAAREMGYLTKGSFKPIPAKGSPEHIAIKERQKHVLERLKAEAAANPPPPPASPTPPAAPAAAVTPAPQGEKAEQKAVPPKPKPKAKPKAKPKPKTKPKTSIEEEEERPDAAPLPKPPRHSVWIPKEHFLMGTYNLDNPTPVVVLPPKQAVPPPPPPLPALTSVKSGTEQKA